MSANDASADVLRGPSGAPWRVAPRLRLVPDVLARGAGVPAEPPSAWAFTESCFFRAGMSAVMGGAMGAFFGAVFSGYGSLAPYDPALRDWQAGALAQQQREALAAAAAEAKAKGLPPPAPGTVPAAVLPGLRLPGAPPSPYADPPSLPLRTHVIEGLKEMRVRAASQGKTFALVGGVYSLVECGIESVRGKKDMKGAIASGFITGATLAARAGPQAMILGGAGFAAFSIVIELVSPMLFDH
jgi:import inner membrane translocase subunit TIM22